MVGRGGYRTPRLLYSGTKPSRARIKYTRGNLCIFEDSATRGAIARLCRHLASRGFSLTKLRLVTYKELKKLAEAAGFQWQRYEGSHNTFKNAQGRIIVIPDHGSQVIVRPLLRKILRDMGLGVEEYHKILDEL